MFMKATTLLVGALIVSSVGALIVPSLGDRGVPTAQTDSDDALSVEGRMPSLEGATEWLNSTPQTAASLRGKVVLVDFWTFSCINSIRQLPYLRAWAKKYKDQGLVVIAVQAPEFEFEKDLDNVHQAVKDMHIDFPMAVDNNHAIWNDFNNEYWPALYFVDANGRIRHHLFGEGDYANSERIIQQLLTEAGATGVSHEVAAVRGQGAEADADWGDLHSQENYVGYARTENFDSPEGIKSNRLHTYTVPKALALNHWALAGDWTIGKQATMSEKAGGRIVYRFHARDLHLVMGPVMKGTPVRFRVLIDGKPPGDAHGGDVDAQGNGTAIQQRMYQLIRQTKPIVDRQFEIEFLDPGVETFSFTFG